MPLAAYFFFVSLLCLLGMLAVKAAYLESGRFGRVIHFFSRFDTPLGVFLIRFSEKAHQVLVSLKTNFVAFLRLAGHSFTVYLHQLLLYAERRARAWREFARERKIGKRSASVFIQDVAEYKRELKKNEVNNQPPTV